MTATSASSTTFTTPLTNLHSDSDSSTQSPPTTILPQGPSVLKPKGSLPNTPFAVSLISTLLGSLCTLSLTLSLLSFYSGFDAASTSFPWATPHLGLYLTSWSFFHLMEFWVTAEFNPSRLNVDSFLLNNGASYHIAHAFGISEYILESYFFPSLARSWWSRFGSWYIALPLLIGAQALRSLAMIHAAQSFSHVVARKKADDHVLVTHGVYQFSRHPSYTGFFYWALSTQLFLSNPIAVLAFSYSLSRFFGERIRDEEIYLVRFFGNEYVEYRKKVGTWLPIKLGK